MSLLTAPLAIFNGPYAILARLGVVATVALACAGFGAVQMHRHDAKRYDALAADFARFSAGVAAAGAQAQKDADARIAVEKRNKETADAEHARTTAALHADIDRMRRARPGGGFVPAAGAAARRPELACFDRGELELAIRAFDAGVSGLVDEGSQGAVDLNGARAWAATRQ